MVAHNSDITERLEWESQGKAEGVGICLSGGGLRAAMFSLGVLQTLQEQQGLLFGSRAARYLSAVSGGSYIASAYVANGAHLAASQRDSGSVTAPFSSGTPEEEHLLSNGHYLVIPKLRQGLKLALGVVAGPAALSVTLMWIGFSIANFSVIVRWYELPMPLLVDGWPLWLTAPLAAASLIALGRSLFAETVGRALLWWFPGLIAALAFLPPVAESLYSFEPLRTPVGWILPLLLSTGLVGLCAALAFIGALLPVSGALLNRLEKYSVLLLVFLLFGASATLFRPLIVRIFAHEATGSDITLFICVLTGPFVAARLVRRASIHQFYRESLNRAFGAIRISPNKAVVPKEPHMFSTLRRDGRLSPKLLVSATANVRHKTSTNEFRTFTSFVFSDGQCGIPSSPMWFDTTKLELTLDDAYLRRGTEPLVSLSTSVAATGAAISASMGRYTRPSRRLVLALLNVRLGRTLPNASRPARRAQVAALSTPGRIRTRVAFLPGLDDLIAELLDVNGPNMYISDGGHYDNLGLMALLRARCKTVWCVDASPDKWGAAEELSRVAALAKDELQVSVCFDQNAFRTTTLGVFPVTHLQGSIDYGDGNTGVINIIKLGLHVTTPPALTDYRRHDRAFPHHSTIWQIYLRHRMEAYRDLGRDNCARCLRDLPSPSFIVPRDEP